MEAERSERGFSDLYGCIEIDDDARGRGNIAGSLDSSGMDVDAEYGAADDDMENWNMYRKVKDEIDGVLDNFGVRSGVSGAGDVTDEEILVLLLLILIAASIGSLDGRSLRGPPTEKITIRSDFYVKLKAQQSPSEYRKTLRCNPEAFVALCAAGAALLQEVRVSRQKSAIQV
ncbi:unnamed protein product [Phytophthora fragariaefolia]|uniref:Unnamed protein product n=1 Tax=Phytophthora fragariaefolia TaxID=1490495 RepID=A0A9W6X134_9STRA|nr:unnamed protein product [Phytophthora fragariaefolia]